MLYVVGQAEQKPQSLATTGLAMNSEFDSLFIVESNRFFS
jgi:hypothetical protein